VTVPIKVTIGEIEALAQKLRDGTRAMDEVLGRLDAEVDLLKGAWSGAALEAYEVAQRQWRATMTEMKDGLEQFSRDTVATASDYQDTSRSVGNVWGR
jgi:early secretory antigenic target protein ESAT-6